MNWKKGLTIGILAITAISLVGCAIFLNKYKQYKPKTQEAAAEYQFDSYNHTTEYFTITGETTLGPLVNRDLDVQTATINNYTITKNTTFGLNIQIQPNTILTDEDEQGISGYTLTQQIITRSNPIQNIELTQVSIFEYDIDENDNPLNYAFTYKTIIHYTNTEETTTKQDTLYINASNIYIEITYSDHEIELEKIDIANNIATFNQVYNTGYTTGYQNKGDLADGNFLDIRNMMLSVLTMPFTFINQAFNVTMWEGTAYEFNVSNFILSLIAIATILFIIRLFTSGFSVIGNYTTSRENRQLTRSQTKLNKAKTEKIKKETK